MPFLGRRCRGIGVRGLALFERRSRNWLAVCLNPHDLALKTWRRKAGDDGVPVVQTDRRLEALWRQIGPPVSIGKENDLLVARAAQGLVGACHGLAESAEYPEIEELLDSFKQSAITPDPSIRASGLPKPSSTQELSERIAAEDADREVWSLHSDALAQPMEIARLLERLSTRKTSRLQWPDSQESTRLLLRRACRDHDRRDGSPD